MTMHRKFMYAAVVGTSLAMAGCWGDSDDPKVDPAPPVVVVPPPPVVLTEVPTSAGLSAAALVSFILALVAGDETSEPLTISSTFVAPVDDTGEPTVL